MFRLHWKLNSCIKPCHNTFHLRLIKRSNLFTRRSLNLTTDDLLRIRRVSCRRNWRGSRGLWLRVGELPLYNSCVLGELPSHRVVRQEGEGKSRVGEVLSSLIENSSCSLSRFVFIHRLSFDLGSFFVVQVLSSYVCVSWVSCP